MNGKKVTLSRNQIKAQTAPGKEYSNEYVVAVVKKSLSDKQIRSMAQSLNSAVPDHLQSDQPELGDSQVTAMKVPEGRTVEAFIAELNARSDVLYVEPGYKRTLSWTPNDPQFSNQWQLQNVGGGIYGIQMPLAWDYVDSQLDAQLGAGNHYGGRSTIIVAVLDTGLAMNNRTVDHSALDPDLYEQGWDFDPTPEIPANLWTNPGEVLDGADNSDANLFIDDIHGVNIDDYYNYEYAYGGHTEEDGYPDDDYGHGTHVASIIAGATNNGSQGAGIAPNVQIMPIKVFDFRGSTWTFSIIDAIAYAIDNGAHVINMSFGGPDISEVEEQMINQAVVAGIIPVAASGNTGTSIRQYPAAYANCIAVGASNPNGSRSSYSTYGDWLDLSAPVGSSSSGLGFSQYNYQCYHAASQSNPLPCTLDEGTSWDPTVNSFKSFSFAPSQGTSFAAPQVSAAAALLKSVTPSISFAQARYKLRWGSTQIGATRFTEGLGYGVLDVYGALTQELPTQTFSAVHRFWSDRYKHHFYTNSEAEKDNVIANLWFDWTYEGIAYYSTSTCPEAMTAVYRFWSPVYRGHFYTISSSERDYVISSLSHDWTYEGPGFCASTASRPDLTAVYRFWSNRYRGHFYTTSAVERDYVIANLAHDWTYEGVAFYVSPTASML
ncbi:MAG: S8 family serine peptidase [Candidatus Dojkabacteria bacterium]|nr:S8 family serine peptidase [Candidatus Dojkabacteria bacterium]